jgi:hypothetical protein
VNFPKRSDISIAIAALKMSGGPKPDGFEFSKFTWRKTPPNRIGANYHRMVAKWLAASKSREFLRLNEL